MHLLSSLLFAISANMDNLTVSIAYGIKKIKIGKISNLIIAIISGIGTFLSMSIGTLVSKFLSPNAANIIGSVILIVIGTWFIAEFFLNKRKEDIKKSNYSKNNLMNYRELLDTPEKADADGSGYIDLKEAVVLGFALTINNIGLGIGVSITGLNILITTFCTFVFSILSIILGCFIGNSCLSGILGKYASLISSIIIVCLGIYEIFV